MNCTKPILNLHGFLNLKTEVSFSPSKPRKWLHEIIKNNDLESIKMHGFRHTHASLLFDSGMILKQVQYRYLKTTMNVYTHITESAKDNIGDKFSAYIDF
nr:tyrosine-type recombinase/integrase [Lactococcus cremoris]